MKKIKEAWAMVKLSGRVVGRNPLLLGYLAAAGLAVLLLFGAALTPIALNSSKDSTRLLEPYATMTPAPAGAKKHLPVIKAHWAPLLSAAAGVYFPGMIIIVFFNVAFLLSVKKILNGGAVSFKGGLALAWEKRSAVLQWALFSATVGVMINVLKSKMDNWLARQVLGLAELGWNLAVFLAVPVVAAEGGTPVQALKRSAEIFRKTWGQTLAGGIGIGALQLLVWLAVGVLPGIYLFYIGLYNNGGHYVLSLAGVAWILLSLLPIAALGETVLMVFRMVLYVFAVEGVVPEEYKEQDCAWFVAQRG